MNNFEDRFIESVMGYIDEFEKDNIKLSHDGKSYYLNIYNYGIDVNPYTLRYEDTPKMMEAFKLLGVDYRPFINQFKFGNDEVNKVSFQLTWGRK